MDSTVNRQEYHVRDLGTRAVTVFPTQAQVVREIKAVSLKPGANEIVVVGLTPTTDEHSIKVEGTGSAIITDISCELLPNRDIFEEMYPDSDTDCSSRDSHSDEDDDRCSCKDDDARDDPDDENEALEDVLRNLASLRDRQKLAEETIASANKQLNILNAFGDAIANPEHKNSPGIVEGLAIYRRQRGESFRDYINGTAHKRELEKEIARLEREKKRLRDEEDKKTRKARMAKAKAMKAKRKEDEKEALRAAETRREKARVRQEGEKFWPKMCYTVRISLDVSGLPIPSPSSSRSSVADDADVVKVTAEPELASGDDHVPTMSCDLALSYVTSSAGWTPSYDVELSTTCNMATLFYDARLTNTTSEVWSNCKMVLSTSQTIFTGLNDAIPVLQPWHMKLAPKGHKAPFSDIAAGQFDTSGIMASREEQNQKNGWAAQLDAGTPKSRAQLFGLDKPSLNPLGQAPSQAANVFTKTRPNNLFGSTSVAKPGKAAGQFGSNTLAVLPRATGSALSAFGAPRNEYSSTNAGGLSGAAGEREKAQTPDLEETQEALTFRESTFEETGLTETYELHGLKTLKPSSTASKQRIAHISLPDVLFSHTVVAKYTPAAYLKAKLRNTSKLTLLKGPAGLTLDGTFLGRTTMPRCGADDGFSLGLGVDPSIRVAYAKPEVRRSMTGIFSREDSAVYVRTITLANTRAATGAAGQPVSLTVLDQVPVSEDEKLRITVLQPHGLQAGAASVSLDISAGQYVGDRGMVKAQLKKAGEIVWDVRLNAGLKVTLMLEYEVAAPSGEHIMQC